jgi:hypothetical protein
MYDKATAPLISELFVPAIPTAINCVITFAMAKIINDKPYSVLLIRPSNENGFLNILFLF